MVPSAVGGRVVAAAAAAAAAVASASEAVALADWLAGGLAAAAALVELLRAGEGPAWPMLLLPLVLLAVAAGIGSSWINTWDIS